MQAAVQSIGIATKRAPGAAILTGSFDARPGTGLPCETVLPPSVFRSLLPHQAGAQPCSSCPARTMGICAAITAPDLHRLAAMAQVSSVAPGRTIIEEGSPARDFFSVVLGTVRIYKMLPDGRRQITGFATTGHLLGLAASADYAFSAEAVDRVRICRYSRQKLRQLLAEFPAMEQRLLETAANELITAQEQMVLLGRKSARERIASFLLGRCSPTQKARASEWRVHLPMTRADIADYLGLTIETVSRTLSRLRADELIAIRDVTEIVILDPHRFEGLAGPAG